MIALDATARDVAMRYFMENVGSADWLRRSLNESLLFLPRVVSSRNVVTVSDLGAGNGQSFLLKDIFRSLEEANVNSPLYVLDTWSDNGDIHDLPSEGKFEPSVVYRVCDDGQRVTMNDLQDAFKKCFSFVTVWFAKPDSHSLAFCFIAISAFDQEGCVVWQRTTPP